MIEEKKSLKTELDKLKTEYEQLVIKNDKKSGVLDQLKCEISSTKQQLSSVEQKKLDLYWENNRNEKKIKQLQEKIVKVRDKYNEKLKGKNASMVTLSTFPLGLFACFVYHITHYGFEWDLKKSIGAALATFIGGVGAIFEITARQDDKEINELIKDCA